VIHRHLETREWTLMAIESLFDRGTLADWREFFTALQHDPKLAERALTVCRYREPDGAEQIALALIEHLRASRPG
jgi:hypothetical protein